MFQIVIQDMALSILVHVLTKVNTVAVDVLQRSKNSQVSATVATNSWLTITVPKACGL